MILTGSSATSMLYQMLPSISDKPPEEENTRLSKLLAESMLGKEVHQVPGRKV